MSTGVSFGRVIKTRRRALDMTQQDLASQVGYSVVTIRKVEADERRPSRQLAERLARCLNIEPDQQQAFVGLARLDRSGARDGDAALGSFRALADRSPTNLAAPLTRLIGREDAVGAVRTTMMRQGTRLVTLVGPPGIGKSRLSVQVAGELRPLFPDGVFVVALAPLGDEALLAPTIATVLGVREVASVPLVAALVEHLRERQVLLLLDNCEHMLGAAPLVAELLTACVDLRVLATSRAPLRIRGERLFPVPPLALPPGRASNADRDERAREGRERHGLNGEAAAGYPAVELFVERAQAVDPAFALTDANAADVAAICAGVDGLPLAIELVAARIALLGPQQILARLGRRLTLLTDGPRDLPERQQTLRRTIDWSYDLLDPGEQILFARLAVFTGSFSLRAAEEVSDVDNDLPLPVLDGLAGLADKNLLRRDEHIDGERHSAFFETIREYALERLVERGEERLIRSRHAAYYLSLVEMAKLGGAEQDTWLNRLEAAHNNLRAVLEWHAECGDADAALRLVAALWKFWHIRSYHTDADRWIALVLGLPGQHDPAVRAYVLYGAGWIAVDRNDHARARGWFDDSLALFRSLHHQRGIAESLHGVGAMLQAAGDSAEAIALFEESLALYRELDDAEGIAWSLDHLGRSALGLRDNAGARDLFESSRDIFSELGHRWGQAISLVHLGLADLAQRDHVQAGERFGAALDVFQELGSSWGVATSFDHLGYVALAGGDLDRAALYFGQSLTLNQAEADRDGVVRSLAGLASVAVAGRRLERAACLFGALDALAGGAAGHMDPVVRGIYQSDLVEVRTHLDRAAVARAWTHGRSLNLTEAAAHVSGGGLGLGLG